MTADDFLPPEGEDLAVRARTLTDVSDHPALPWEFVATRIGVRRGFAASEADALALAHAATSHRRVSDDG